MKKKHIDTTQVMADMLKEAKGNVSRYKQMAEIFTDDIRETQEHLQYLQENYDSNMKAAAMWEERVAVLLMLIDKCKPTEKPATTGKPIARSFFVPADISKYDNIVDQLAKLGHVDDYQVEFGGDEQYEFIFRSDVDIEELIGLLDI